MSVRSELRVVVFELAQNQCEHPRIVAGTWSLPFDDSVSDWRGTLSKRCQNPAVELAHIWPRGMGHTGYRDTLDNVIAACELHARSTDDLSSPEWQHVPAPHDRKALAEWIKLRRVDWPIETVEDWHPHG